MGFGRNALGGALKVVLTGMSRGSLPRTDGTITLPGLEAEVEVIRDKWGVPHIYASSTHDLFFAQGFVHAQDRLSQMEVNRRLARGRLAELFGAVALETDRATRTFGFDRLGRTDYDQAGPLVRGVIDAYTAGVNAFLTQPKLRLPVEYKLVGHRPEPWAAADTMAFTRLMMWQLSHAWYGEIVRAQVIEAVGAERAAELEVHYPPGNPVSLPKGIEFHRQAATGGLPGAGGRMLRRGLGSNSWVVSGRLTDTGKPYLCNDMHLAAMLPGLWYEVHLVGGDFNVFGVSLPGVPAILVGHNDRIAWGMTLAFTDCEDLFVEKFDPADPHRYEFRGEWREAEVIKEPIRVKGQAEPVVEEVVVTHHGPVIGHVVGCPERKMAVQSMALRPCPAFEGWLSLDRARNWDDFVAAMRLVETPQLNVTYADVDGNIGFWVTGKVPIRAEGSKGRGMVPATGWTGDEEWVGEVPFQEMPHAFNPEQGYLVTCNHKITPDDYPYFLGTVWMNGYRARRLVDLIEPAGGKLGRDDFESMQMDLMCLPGLEFVKRLEGLEGDADAALALKLLRSWDGRLTTDSVGGTVYEVARYTLVRSLLEPGLGPELARRVMGQGFHPLLQAASEVYGHDTVAMLRMLDDTGSWWVAQAGGRRAVLEKSLGEAVRWLRGRLGSDPRGWQWGRLHRITFPHAMAVQPPMDLVFNVGPMPIGGDTDTVCQTAMLVETPYDSQGWAPTFREIVDLGDLGRSVTSVPPGQSGQLGSRHYSDLAGPWLRGEYHAMLWERGEVERQAEARLVLAAEGPG